MNSDYYVDDYYFGNIPFGEYFFSGVLMFFVCFDIALLISLTFLSYEDYLLLAEYHGSSDISIEEELDHEDPISEYKRLYGDNLIQGGRIITMKEQYITHLRNFVRSIAVFTLIIYYSVYAGVMLNSKSRKTLGLCLPSKVYYKLLRRDVIECFYLVILTVIIAALLLLLRFEIYPPSPI